jgi:hypothetical protein
MFKNYMCNSEYTMWWSSKSLPDLDGPGFKFWQRQDIFSCPRIALGSIQSPVRWVISWCLGHEPHHLPTSSAEFKN